MDDFVKNQLTEWSLLEKLGPAFNENEIDEESFNNLNENDVKELIPILGIRKKFLAKLKEYQAIIQAIEHAPVIEADRSYLRQLSTPSTSSADDVSVGQITDEESAISTENLIPVPYPLRATVGLPYVISTHTNSVRKLLDSCEEGTLIKASYGKKFLRSHLCSLIIKNELKGDLNKKITSDRFRELADEINQVFLHEWPELYYVPYVKNYGEHPKAARDDTFSLTILPLLFRPSNIKSKIQGKHWRPSKCEIQSGFLLHIKDITELEPELLLRQEKYKEFGLTAQPLPVIIGDFDVF